MRVGVQGTFIGHGDCRLVLLGYSYMLKWMRLGMKLRGGGSDDMDNGWGRWMLKTWVGRC